MRCLCIELSTTSWMLTCMLQAYVVISGGVQHRLLRLLQGAAGPGCDVRGARRHAAQLGAVGRRRRGATVQLRQLMLDAAC